MKGGRSVRILLGIGVISTILIVYMATKDHTTQRLGLSSVQTSRSIKNYSWNENEPKTTEARKVNEPKIKDSQKVNQPNSNDSWKGEQSKINYSTNMKKLTESRKVNKTEINNTKNVKEPILNESRKVEDPKVNDTGNVKGIKIKESGKVKESKISKCSCKSFIDNKSHWYLSVLSREDPFAGVPGYQVLLESHPNVGPLLLSKNEQCNFIPIITGLSWNGVWQTAELSNATYHIYSAHCDVNEEDLCTIVRILTMTTKPDLPQFCYLWGSTVENPVVTSAIQIDKVDYQTIKMPLYPYLISCHLPSPMNLSAVSISDKPCSTVSNIAEIKRNTPQKEMNNADDISEENNYRVGVCGPLLFYYFEDISHQLVEWMEILKVIGVTKVFLYSSVVHPNVNKVLQHYKKANFLGLTTFTFPSPYIDDPILKNSWTLSIRREMFALENIYFTDCVQRNKHQFRYLMHLDPDELPFIHNFTHISEFVKFQMKPYSKNDAFNIRLSWKTFHLNVPPGPSVSAIAKDYFFLGHNQADEKCEKKLHCNNYKSIYDTRQTLMVSSHEALKCLQGNCKELKAKDALTAHFRRECTGDCWKDLKEYNFLQQFAARVIPNVKKVLLELQI